MRYHLIEAHRPATNASVPSRWPHHVTTGYDPRLRSWWAAWVDARGYSVGLVAYGETEAAVREALPAREDVRA